MDCNRDDPSISDDDSVYRRIPEDWAISDDNLRRFRLSSQAFKQGGTYGLVSVYLASETSPDAVMAEGRQVYLVEVGVGTIRDLGLGVIRSPESGGPGHCDITGRKTKSVLNRIAKQARWVAGYAPPSWTPP